MEEYKIGGKFGISVQTLYKALGKNLQWCIIDHYTQDGSEYFDLLNVDRHIVAMDGETCYVNAVGSNQVILSCKEDDFSHMFALSMQEADIALFPAIVTEEGSQDGKEQEKFLYTLDRKQTEVLIQQKKLAGCFRMYGDGTEGMIEEDYTEDDIRDFLDKGGKIGTEYKTVSLPDGPQIKVPDIVVVPDMGYMDEMEEALWDTVRGYFTLFGIEIDDADTDFYMIKEMEGIMLKFLEEADVNFCFYDNEQ